MAPASAGEELLPELDVRRLVMPGGRDIDVDFQCVLVIDVDLGQMVADPAVELELLERERLDALDEHGALMAGDPVAVADHDALV